MDLTKTSTTEPNTYAAVGDILTYDLVVKNTGNVTLTNIVVSDPVATVVGSPIASLAPGASATVTASYAVTQADLDAGSFTNTATASTTYKTTPVSDTDSETVNATETPLLDLTKTSTTEPNTYAAVGDILTYDLVVKNTGNVTLTNIVVSDPVATVVGSPIASLAPGASATVTASYAVTQADLDAGSFTNTATASTTYKTTPVSDTDSETVNATETPLLDLTKTSTTEPNTYAAVGDILTYDLVVKNTGNVTLTNIVVSDPVATVVGSPIASLAPGASATVTASYAVTQADLDAGSFTNTATASTTYKTTPVSDTDSETVNATETPLLDLTKTSTTEPNTYAAVGDILTYDLVVKNTGNVTLTNIVVSDPVATVVGSPIASLAPGASATVTASYAVTQADLDAGSFTNTATASTTYKTTPVSDTDSETVNATETPLLDLTKTSTTEPNTYAAVGDILTYDLVVKNTGNVTLTNIVVSDPVATVVGSPIASLAPGASATVTASYAVTQADLDAGSFTNTATASTTYKTTPVSDTDSETVNATETPLLDLTKTSTTEPNTYAAVGDILTYDLVVKNTGNVTLTNIVVSDPVATVVGSPIASLAPGASATVTASYAVTQADLDAGSFTNTATASTTYKTTPVSDTDSETVNATETPLLDLTKTSTTEPNTYAAVGDILTYDLVVKNTGNVTLTNIVVSDPVATVVGSPIASLAPGASATVTASYAVTQADLDAGSFTNTATASTTYKTTPVSDTDSETVNATETPLLDLTKTSTTEPNTYAAVGDILTYDLVVKNTGNVTLTNIVVSDPVATVVGSPIASLAPGASATVTASYAVTQADLDAGSFTNTATASTTYKTTPVSDTDSETVNATETPLLDLTKTSTTEPNTYAAVGDILTYDLVVKNTGNVTLTNIVVSDPVATVVGSPIASLAPGASATVTASYAVTQADLDAGSFTNTATASTTYKTTPVSDTDSETVNATETPLLDLTKTSTTEPNTYAAVGDILTYDLVVKNTGNVTLTNIVVSDPVATVVGSPIASLAPGASATVTASYAVTQADLDAGSFTNTATASTTYKTTPVSDTDSETVNATETPLLDLTKTSTTEPNTYAAVGDILTYDLVVKNTGNVTLTNIVVSDPVATVVGSPIASLAPGASATVTASYAVTQADLDAGSFTNTATASTTYKTTPVSDTDSETVNATETPLLDLTKTSTTEPNTYAAVGDILTYDLVVKNTGNVTLTNIVVSDPVATVVGSPIASLAPGASATVTASYAVTQADLDAGSFTNTATASTTYKTTPVSDTDSETVNATETPLLDLTKTSTTEPNTYAAVGDILTYDLVVKNTGNVTLTNIVVSDPVATVVGSPIASLAPGASATVTASYAVTQADLDAGSFTNTATASTTYKTTPVSDTDSETVNATETPLLDLTKTSTTEPNTYAAVGDILTYDLVVKNTGNVTLTNIVVSDPVATVVGSPIASLAPGASATVTASYAVTQADLDAGSFTNTATASTTYKTTPVSDTDSETVNATETPLLDLTKTSTTEPNTYAAVGDILTYDLVVKNTGNVTLTNIVVSDPVATVVGSPIASLAPGASATVTASYAVTQADLDAGSFTNTATASTTYKTTPVSDTDSETVNATETPLLDLTKTSTTEPNTYAAVGDILTYDLVVKNTGNVTLTNIVVSDPVATVVGSPIASLAPGASATVTASYAVTQADLDAGSFTNTATASTTYKTTPVSDTDSETVNATETPLLDLTKTSTTEPNTYAAVGDILTYDLVVKNTGNVTLTNIVVSDPVATVVGSPIASLAPGASATVTASYAVTQADLDAGSFTNTATASTTYKTTPVSDTDSETVNATETPLLDLTKTSTTEPNTYAAVGDILTYDLVVKNTGNVTLTNIVVSDPVATVVGSPIASLAPGASATVTASYAVTQADLDAGSFTNTATASTTYKTTPVSDTDSETVNATETPLLDLTKTSTTEPNTYAAVGDILTYDLVVKNTGNVTLTNIVVSDPVATVVGSPIASLAPGASATVTASYAVTQADLDAGSFTNTATASTTYKTTPVSDTDSETVNATETPLLDLTKTSTTEPNTYAAVGDILTYDLVVKNTGNVTLTNIVVSDPVATVVGSPIASLAPGASATVTASYAVTQADLDAGSFTNTATASTTYKTTPVSDTDSETVNATETPLLDLTKTSTTEPNTYAAVGDILTYDLVVKNTGNVTLTNIVVSDPVATVVGSPIASLAPGASATVTASYAVTQADLDAGSFTNTATASTTYKTTPVSDTDSETVNATETPLLDLTKTSTTEPNTYAAVGDILTYDLVVKNTGNVTLTNIVVSDPVATVVGSPIASLAPGASATVTASYAVTQADLDAGSFTNTATASTTYKTTPVSDTDSETVNATETPLLDLTKTSTTEPNTYAAVGDILTYDLVVKNTGNVTLTNIVVSDPVATVVGSPIASLAPGASATVTASYAVTQADLDAGSFTNTATASTTYKTTPVSDTDSETVNATETPLLDLTKTSTTEPNTYAAVGDILTYDLVVKNTGNVTLTNIVVSDPVATVVGSPIASLAPGASATVTASYAVTQADLDAGSFTNTATASTTYKTTPVSDTDSETVNATETPLLDLTKTSTTEPNTYAAVGDILTYDLVVKNTGNVTLTNIVVSDPVATVVGSPIASLAPGASATVTASYAVTQADLDAGSFTNTATASTTYKTTPVSDTDSETVNATETPLLDLTKTSTTEPNTYAAVGDILTYDLVVKNTGNVTLTNIVVSDPVATVVGSPIASLAPGASATVTASYAVTQADLDAGSFTNTATASTTYKTTPVSDTDSETVNATETPLLDLTKTSTTEPNTYAAVGDILTYDLVVKNTGNVTLTNIVVSDPVATVVGSPIASLAPGASATVTASYAVTQADLDAGSFTNTATASTTYKTTPVSDTDSETVNATETPLLDLTKTSTTEPNTYAAVGDILTYDLVVKNTGNVTLTNIVVSDPVATVVGSPIASLAPGASATVTASYAVTQADLDAGSFTNTATASTTYKTTPVSDTDSETV
ncbi:MAG: hypothetical protein ACJLTB_10695, partial [Algoriphagus aquaeductus]